MESNFWTAAYIILFVVVIIQMVVIYMLFKTMRDFLQGIQNIQGINYKNAISKGQPAPAFKKRDQFDKFVKIGLNQEKPTVLIFGSSKCSSCKGLIDSLDKSYVLADYKIVFVFENKNIEEQFLNKLTEYKISFLIHTDLFDLYSINNTPTIIAINNEGRVLLSEQLDNWGDITNRLINPTAKAI
ncbi:hypothetical protein DFO70_12554 [Cytobacillus firmus]|uniref:Thioredoxin domain-containing protein n=2 Tax=Cytobacillus TaxID=2675230 RepID=A0A366JJI9_CYTFI|nr:MULTISPECIES: hypothetical protein [Cytobacillus]RBP86586.1 hypothetical protein DFO70_12554 [Cytobacillus firmus]TDX39326.1 hypothetical protein DFO72_111157 [Cytobacillus oceanisediminis]